MRRRWGGRSVADLVFRRQAYYPLYPPPTVIDVQICSSCRYHRLCLQATQPSFPRRLCRPRRYNRRSKSDLPLLLCMLYSCFVLSGSAPGWCHSSATRRLHPRPESVHRSWDSRLASGGERVAKIHGRGKRYRSGRGACPSGIAAGKLKQGRRKGRVRGL